MTVDDDAFDPSRSRRGYLFVRLADYLAERIADGRLPAGARLPSHIDMAEEYNVSTNTIVRALDTLRERGLVETFPYIGTFVVEHPPKAPAAAHDGDADREGDAASTP